MIHRVAAGPRQNQAIMVKWINHPAAYSQST